MARAIRPDDHNVYPIWHVESWTFVSVECLWEARRIWNVQEKTNETDRLSKKTKNVRHFGLSRGRSPTAGAT